MRNIPKENPVQSVPMLSTKCHGKQTHNCSIPITNIATQHRLNYRGVSDEIKGIFFLPILR
jgi:hypothetical protein